MTPQETDPGLPRSAQESPAEAWVTVAAERSSASVGPSEGVAFIFITSTVAWLQIKQQGGKQPCLSTENWFKDLLSMAPPIRTRPSFPLVSLSQ